MPDHLRQSLHIRRKSRFTLLARPHLHGSLQDNQNRSQYSFVDDSDLRLSDSVVEDANPESRSIHFLLHRDSGSAASRLSGMTTVASIAPVLSSRLQDLRW